MTLSVRPKWKSREDRVKLRVYIAPIVLLDLILQYYFRRRDVGQFNTGISFGLGAEGMRAIIIFLCVLFFLIYIKSRKQPGITMLIFGGLGNFLPRLVWGGVQDYLKMPFIPLWFNISDILITGGVLIYLWNTEY